MGTTPRGIVYPDPSGVPARSDLETLAETADTAITGLFPAWTAFTPAFTSGISALGNATVSAKRVVAGELVIGHAHITMGSTTTFSAGAFFLALPVAPAAPANTPIGTVFVQDAGSLSSRRGGTMILASSTTAYFLLDDVANNVITDTAPWTWAATDTLSFSFTYEPA